MEIQIHKTKLLNSANIITLIRFIFIPVFVYLLLTESNSNITKFVFCICILTDLLDGMIARYFKLKTDFGAFFDPLTDKLLILSSFTVLTYINKIPKWLFLTVIGRDFMLISGWLILFILTRHAKVKARPAGKISIVLTMITVVFVLFNLPKIQFVFYATTVFLFISLMDYYLNGIKNLIKSTTK